MHEYDAQQFLCLLFELDSLVDGRYDADTLVVDELRAAMFQTLNGICACYGIPSPREIFKFRRHRRSIDLLIEARRALEVPNARRREFLVGKSPELDVAESICSLIAPSIEQLDQMIAEQLGIVGKNVPDDDVVSRGGYRHVALQKVMAESF